MVFAVVNNRQYKILKGYLAGMGGAAVRTGRFIGMDLDDPPIDYVALARSMAVDATPATRERRRRCRARALVAGRPARDRAPDHRALKPARPAPDRSPTSSATTTCLPASTASTGRSKTTDRWVVLGPNGSGKTTLLHVASLYLHPPASVTWTYDGERLGRTDVRALRHHGIGLASPALRRPPAPASLTGTQVVITARHAALEPWWHTPTTTMTALGPPRCSTGSACCTPADRSR